MVLYSVTTCAPYLQIFTQDGFSVSGGSLLGLRVGTETEFVVKPFAVEGPHIRVEQPWRHATVEDRLPLSGRRDRDIAGGLNRDTGGVRGGDNILQVQQWVVRPRRFLVEYVESCARDSARHECIE